MTRFTGLWGSGVVLVCFLALADTSGAPSASLQPPDPLAGCWQELAAKEPTQAYRATWRLVQHPEQAVKLLGDHLTPAAPPDMNKIQLWLTALRSPKFGARQAAFNELEKQGELAEPALQKALKE